MIVPSMGKIPDPKLSTDLALNSNRIFFMSIRSSVSGFVGSIGICQIIDQYPDLFVTKAGAVFDHSGDRDSPFAARFSGRFHRKEVMAFCAAILNQFLPGMPAQASRPSHEKKKHGSTHSKWNPGPGVQCV